MECRLAQKSLLISIVGFFALFLIPVATAFILLLLKMYSELLVIGFFPSIIIAVMGIITGIKSLSKIKNENLEGKWKAILSIIISFIVLLVASLIIWVIDVFSLGVGGTFA